MSKSVGFYIYFTKPMATCPRLKNTYICNIRVKKPNQDVRRRNIGYEVYVMFGWHTARVANHKIIIRVSNSTPSET